jgi:DNA polymerase-3 subunit beta
MQVKAQRLREAMMLLERTVPRKPKSKIVANVFLKDGKVTATDLDIDVSLDLPEVDIECLLPHREVYEMLKYVDGNDTVTVTPDGGAVKLAWESGKATYYPGKLEDYPVHEGFELSVKGSVNGDKVVKAMMSLVDYCLEEDPKHNIKPVLTGVAVILGEKLELWGADGVRLASVHLDESYPSTETIIIPADTVRTLGFLWSKLPAAPPLKGTLIEQLISKRELRIGLHAGSPLPDDGGTPSDKAVFRFGRLTVVSRLIQGKAPSYSQLIPQDQPLKVRVLGRVFETGAQRLKTVAKDGSGILRMEWDENKLTLSAHGKDTGDAIAEVPVQTEGGPGKTAVNIKYLMEYFKGKDGLVTIAVSDHKSPVTFRYSNTPLVIIIPMFVDWDGSQAAKEKADAEAKAKADEEARAQAATAPAAEEDQPGEEEEEEGEGTEVVETTAEVVEQ